MATTRTDDLRTSAEGPATAPAPQEPPGRRARAGRLARFVGSFRSVSRVYLLLALPAGLAFAFLIPPSQVLDEGAHFNRVWQITQGNVRAEVFRDAAGARVNAGTYDACVREYIDGFMAVAASPEPFDVHDYWFDTPDCSPARKVFVTHEPMGPYSAWSYPGQTVGVAVGRAAGLPLPVTFFLGRVVGLLTTVAMCWWAIRIAPRMKLVLAFVALLPMPLMSASGYSPDGLVLGTSLLLVASCLRFSVGEERCRRRDLVVIIGALTALALTKAPYLFFALLFLCYRPTTFGHARRTVAVLGAVTAVAAVAAGTWYLFGTPEDAAEVYRPGIDGPGQLRWVLTHPLQYANVLSDTFFSGETQEWVLKGWVGAFGMFRTGLPDSPLMVPVFVLLAAAALGALSLREAGPRLAVGGRVAQLRSLVPYVTALVGVLAIYTGAYVAWNQVGDPRIFGVQGRYLVPLLPLPALGLALRHREADTAVGVRALAVCSAVLLAAAFVKIWVYFY